MTSESEPPELFHYTRIQALQGILETNQLWATHADHLNDSSEMQMVWPWLTQQIIARYEQAIRDFLERNPEKMEKARRAGGVAYVSSQDGSAIVSELRERLRADATPYVVSFTTHAGNSKRDDYHRRNGRLSQWRGYGGSNGVAIVFDTKEIKRFLQRECERFLYWPWFVESAIYDWQDADLDVHFPELCKTLPMFARNMILANNHERNEEHMIKLYLELAPAQARLKHAAFEEEQEYRIVVGVTSKSIGDELDATGQSVSRSLKEIHHRPGRCGSIPYVRLFEEFGENLPITRIIVGPSRNQEAIVEAVKDLARPRGIEVQASETPYVGST